MVATSEKREPTFRPLAYGGHALYCRKCIKGTQVADDPMEREIGGIRLPHEYINGQNDKLSEGFWMEVLAKGPKVGTPCSKKHQKVHGRARWFGDDYEVGDLLLCPNMHPTGVKSVTHSKDLFLIEESVPVVLWKGEDDG